jgi:hypothetical protein
MKTTNHPQTGNITTEQAQQILLDALIQRDTKPFLKPYKEARK